MLIHTFAKPWRFGKRQVYSDSTQIILISFTSFPNSCLGMEKSETTNVNNPKAAVRGDGGHTESDSVFWLLPYWMGRYIGILGGNQE